MTALVVIALSLWVVFSVWAFSSSWLTLVYCRDGIKFIGRFYWVLLHLRFTEVNEFANSIWVVESNSLIQKGQK